MMKKLWEAIKNWFIKLWANIKARAIKIWHKFLVAWKDRSSLLWYFLFLVGVGFMFFAYALVTNMFTIPLSGDYTLQQIPFYLNGYDDWWHFLKTGEFVLWDSSTYLGVNNIGSNAFYYLCNPFFLPILLFPRALVPQGLALLMILKMAGAALVFRGFLKYMGVSEATARLFALAYGFCGWNTYYLWFNHFMEVCLVFPLVFWGIEKLLKEKKPWLLMFALFLMGITNFFFLISTCFAGAFYALFRYFQRVKKYSGKDRITVAGLGVLSFAVGIMMAALVVLPAAVTATTSNRVTDATYLPNLIAAFKIKDWQLLLKEVADWEAVGGASYDKYYPLISFFFPTVSCRSSELLNTGSYDNTISSLFIYTPLMMFLIPSILSSIRHKKWSHFIPIAFFLFALFTPFFYYLFHGFTAVDYGRWQIFVVFALLFYIALNFEKRYEMPKWYFDVSFIFTIGMALFVFNVARTYENDYSFSSMDERLFIAIGEFVYMVVVYLFLRLEYKSKNVSRSLLYMVAVEAIVMGTMTCAIQGLTDYVKSADSGITIVTDETQIVRKINKDDKEFFRIYNLNAGESSNLGMRESYNGMTAFHSLYNFEITEFNEWSHMNYNHNGWSMGYHEKRANLDTFLGVKYYIIKNIYDTYSWSGTDEYGHTLYTNQNVPLGFVRVPEYSTNAHTVYRNTNFIEGGFSYENIVETNYNEETGRSDFYGNYADEPIYNEETYLTNAILRNADAEEVIADNPDLSIVARPAMNANLETTTVTKLVCTTGFEASDPNNEVGCTASAVTGTVTGVIPNLTRIIIKPWGKDYFGNLTEGFAYYLRWILDSHATVYVYDTDNNLVARDAHSFVSTSFKYMRGLYSSVPVSQIVIVPHNATARALYYPNLYTESYSDFTARLATLRANPLENVEHTANTFDFDTNYATQRFIAMQVPYDAGWHVTITDASGNKTTPKVYKTQGGFVGFASGVGECHYDLNYWTPYLTEGLLASLAGFLIFGGSWGAAFVIQKKKDEREKAKLEIKPEAK